MDKIQIQIEALSSLNEIVEGQNYAYESQAEASDVVWGQSPSGTVPGDILLGFTQDGSSYNIYDYTSDGRLKSFAVAKASGGRVVFKDIAYDATGRPTAYIKEEHFGKWTLSTTKWSGEFSGDGKLLSYTKVTTNSKGGTEKDSYSFAYDVAGKVREFISNGQRVGLEYNDKGQVVKQVAYGATEIAGDVKDIFYSISYKGDGGADKIFVHVDGKAASKKRAGYTAYDSVIDGTTGEKLSENTPQVIKPRKSGNFFSKAGNFVGKLTGSLGSFLGKISPKAFRLNVGGIVGEWFDKLEKWVKHVFGIGKKDSPAGLKVVEKITEVQAADDKGTPASQLSGDTGVFSSGAARMAVGDSPSGVDISSSGNLAAVANKGSNSISLVTLVTGTQYNTDKARKVEAIQIDPASGNTNPDQVGIEPVGERDVFVSVARGGATKPNSITVYNTTIGGFTGTIEGVGSDIKKMVFGFGDIYVVTDAGISVINKWKAISSLDPADTLKNRASTLIGVIGSSSPVLDIVVASRDNVLSGIYALTADGVYAVDRANLTFTQPPIYSGKFQKIAVSENENRLILFDSVKDELVVVDITDRANPKLDKTIPVGASAFGAGTNAVDMAVSKDGKSAFVIVEGFPRSRNSQVLSAKMIAVDVEKKKASYEAPIWRDKAPSQAKAITVSANGGSILISDEAADELVIFDSEGIKVEFGAAQVSSADLRGISGNASDLKMTYNLVTESNTPQDKEKGMSLKLSQEFDLSQNDLIFGARGDGGTLRVILVDKNGNKARFRIGGIDDLTKWKEVVIAKGISIPSSVFDRSAIREVIVYVKLGESAPEGTVYLDFDNADGYKGALAAIANLDTTNDAPTFTDGLNNSITGVAQIPLSQIGQPAPAYPPKPTDIQAAPVYYNSRTGVSVATRIDFDSTQNTDIKAVFAQRLNDNLSSLNGITFYVDTIQGQGYPQLFTVELKNSLNETVAAYLVSGIEAGSNKITLDISKLSNTIKSDISQIALVLDPAKTGRIKGSFVVVGLFEPAAVELAADDNAIPTFIPVQGVAAFEVNDTTPADLDGISTGYLYPVQGVTTRRLTTVERFIDYNFTVGEKQKGISWMFDFTAPGQPNIVNFYTKGGTTLPRQFYVFVKDIKGNTAHILINGQDTNYNKASLDISKLSGFEFKNSTTGAMDPLDIKNITEIGILLDKDLLGQDLAGRLIIDGIEEIKEFSSSPSVGIDATNDAPTFINGMNNSIVGVTQVGRSSISKDPSNNPTIQAAPVYDITRTGVSVATDISFNLTLDDDSITPGEQHDTRAVFALRLNKDLSTQDQITFYVGTLTGQTYPPEFTIELKDSNKKRTAIFHIKGIQPGSNKITLDITNFQLKNDIAEIALVLDPKITGAIAGQFRTIGLFEPAVVELAADDGNDPNTFPVYGTATFEIGSATPTGLTTELIHNGSAYTTRRLGRERRVDVDLMVNDNEKGLAWLLFDPKLASLSPSGQQIQAGPGQGQDLRGKAIKFYLKGEGANFPDQFYLFVKDTAGRSARVAVTPVGSSYKMFTLEINNLSAAQLDTGDISEIGILFDKKLVDPQRLAGAILIDGIELIQTTTATIPAVGDSPTLLNNTGNGALGTFIVVNPPPATPIDTTPFISAKYVYDSVRGDMGAATEVTFDLRPALVKDPQAQPDPQTDGKARGVYAMRVNKDFSAIPSLTFFVDTIAGSGYPASFILEFKNSDGTIATSRLITIQQGENKITIPLNTLLFKNDVGQISIILDPAVAGQIEGKFRVHGLFEPATLIAQPDGGSLIGLSAGGGYEQMVAFAPAGGGSAASYYDMSNTWRGAATVEVQFNAAGGTAYAVVELKSGYRDFTNVQNLLIPIINNPSGVIPNQLQVEVADGSGNTAVFLVTGLSSNATQIISVPLSAAVEVTRSIDPSKVLNRADIRKYTIRLSPEVISDPSKRAGRFNIVSVNSPEIGTNVPPPGGAPLPIVHPINFSTNDIGILLPEGNYLRGVQDANFRGMNKLFDLQTGLPFDISTINNGDVDQTLSRLDPNQAKTSPTNIAMGLLSIIAMRDGGFITGPTAAAAADAKVEKIVEQLEKMRKQNGFFYRYYSLIQSDSNGAPDVYGTTDEISTIDNGNLTAAMMMAREAVTDDVLKTRLDALIAAQNYNFFLNPGDTYLHGAYNVNSASLTTWGISDITDEGRNAALIGVLLNGISDTAWTALNKTPTTYITQSGVSVSVGARTWGGDVFPALFGSLLTGEEKLSPDQIGRNNKALTLAHIDTSRRLGYQFDSIFSPSEVPSVSGPANKYAGSGVPAVANNRQDPMQPNQVPLYAALLALRYTPAEAVNAIKRITALNPDAFSSQFGFVDSIDNTLVVNDRLLSLDKGMEVLTLHNILQALSGTGAALDSYFWAYLDRVGKGAQGRSLIQGVDLY
ncbi:MAG: hypothetical protein HY589_03940 [Candidatus Omnitrophica bacterium]|nr:hypothetical protein [Candidatus Omnitrophota bacterium]